MSKKSTPKVSGPLVYADHQRRTCIALSRDEDFVLFIPMNIEGIDVQRESAKNFDGRYKPLHDYPIDRAAKLYAEYAADIGGSKEAMDELAKLTNLSAKEIEMATAKKAVKPAETKPAAKKAVATKAPAAKPAKPAKEAKAPAAKPTKEVVVTKGAKAPVAKPTKEAKAPAAKRDSAAQMFKDLIMEGKLTDDKIFEKVAARFGLDADKRGHVRWYRNWLVRNGQKPPAAKK